MPATKRPVRDPVSGTRARGAGVRRKERRPASKEIKAEIEALKKKIERELIELQVQADRLMVKSK
jgi:hypothetical protein